MPSREYPAVIVLGPTASGKTSLSMSLASRFDGEIVCCDALQIYRHMDIGTAKPSAAAREGVPHHMIDLRNPDEYFSAGDYQRLAREVLRGIRSRSRVPFIEGGSGFYLRALIHGLFEGPRRSEQVRSRLRNIVARRGTGLLHRALCRVDPQAGARIAPSDSARIIRAYEVYLDTGTPISQWQHRMPDNFEGFRWLKLGIDWPRAMLYQRIDKRVEEMLQAGFADEVRSLLDRFPRECHPFKAIGYKQVGDYLEGRSTLDQAIEQIQRASRHYAKRQLTWFRSDPEVIWLPGQDSESLQTQASARVAELVRPAD